jgi:type III secretory pathway component EscV
VSETLDILIHDARFWTAILFLFQTLLFLLVPGFPPELWTALSGVLAIVFAAFTTKATVAEKRSRAIARSMKQE